MARLFFQRSATVEISPEEIFLDSHNLPSYESGSLEGRIVKPIGTRALQSLALLFLVIGGLLFVRIVTLMVIHGNTYLALSENNMLERSTIPAERGVIYDRNGVELAWNTTPLTATSGASKALETRAYATTTGLGHVLGYVHLPARDAAGNWYRTTTEGIAGTELAYDTLLRGTNGIKIVETDAHMRTVSEELLQQPVAGTSIHLTIDALLTDALAHAIGETVERVPFRGGAGVIMDVHSGEVLALTSYPEYDPHILLSGDANQIATYEHDVRTPYLNRAVSGQYTPGSIVKPFVAIAALTEGIVRPETEFISTGQIRLENAYDPGQYSVFRDWRAHGAVDMRHALAVSSDVYFYYVGGGFGSQTGLGISRIHDYMKLFGFGAATGIPLRGEAFGIIPSIEWKAQTFPDDPTWRVGNTYHTAIGQYGFQVTPVQVVRAVAALANGGLLIAPRLDSAHDAYAARDLGLNQDNLAVVRDGMRLSVTEGTAVSLNVPYVDIAAKTGTAEVGAHKEFVNSWVVGYYPLKSPRYAFVCLMEQGPTGNKFGASYVMRNFFDWVHEHVPSHLDNQEVRTTDP